MKEYAVYKGEEIIAMGTIRQIAKQLNVKEDTVYFYGSPAYQRRGKQGNENQRRVLVKIV